MTRHPAIQPAPRERRLVMVAYPDAHILGVVGPLEVLTGADHDVIWDNPAAALPVIRAFLTAKTR